MPAAAIPSLIGAGGTIGGGLLSLFGARSASRAAMKRTPEEQAALAAQTGLQQQQLAQMKGLYESAKPAADQTLNYYTSLLSGNRQKMDATLRPQVGQINDVAQGAETGLRARGVTGGVLRQGLSRIQTERQRQIGDAYVDAPGRAAQGLSAMTGGLLGASNAAGGNAGMTGANILGSEGANRDRGQAAGSSAATNFGGLIASLLSAYGGVKRGASAGGVLTSRQTVPNSTTWMPGG